MCWSPVLYFLVLELFGRPRIAALSAVIYATGPHYQFFDSYFIYQTIASLSSSSRSSPSQELKSEGRVANGWGVVAVACGAVSAGVTTSRVTRWSASYSAC